MHHTCGLDSIDANSRMPARKCVVHMLVETAMAMFRPLQYAKHMSSSTFGDATAGAQLLLMMIGSMKLLLDQPASPNKIEGTRS